MNLLINKTWAMPSKNAFTIKPIKNLIMKYRSELLEGAVIVYPFANSNKIATITNDLDPQYHTNYHTEATDFLKMLPDNSADMVLYDSVYSPRQLAECYKKFGLSVTFETTQASY